MTRKLTNSSNVNNTIQLNHQTAGVLKKLRIIEYWKTDCLLTYHSVTNISLKQLKLQVSRYSKQGVSMFTTGAKKSLWLNNKVFYFISKGNLMIIKWPATIFNSVTKESLLIDSKLPLVAASQSGCFINIINRPIFVLLAQAKEGPTQLFWLMKRAVIMFFPLLKQLLLPLRYLVIWYLQKQLTINSNTIPVLSR